MEGMNTTNWIIAAIASLIVIIAGGWLIAREKSGGVVAEQMATTTNSLATATDVTSSKAIDSAVTVGEKPTPTAAGSGETVTVKDQVAGNTVTVANVKLSKPTWVAIKGTNGWVLGAAWVNETSDNISVSLVRPTVKGETYQAVLYVDDGDKKFSLHAADTLITDVEGAPVASTFKAD